MKDPVLTIDGFSFERRAIQEWFNKGKVTNPVTNKPLTSTALV
jgi:sacsin